MKSGIGCMLIKVGLQSGMVQNGIEYGMMQAYGEGFQLLKASPSLHRSSDKALHREFTGHSVALPKEDGGK